MSGLSAYRRVVTGLGEDGKSCILLDGPAAGIKRDLYAA